eukprot:2402704-Amphidinium_carterae.2
MLRNSCIDSYSEESYSNLGVLELRKGNVEQAQALACKRPLANVVWSVQRLPVDVKFSLQMLLCHNLQAHFNTAMRLGPHLYEPAFNGANRSTSTSHDLL